MFITVLTPLIFSFFSKTPLLPTSHHSGKRLYPFSLSLSTTLLVSLKQISSSFTLPLNNFLINRPWRQTPPLPPHTEREDFTRNHSFPHNPWGKGSRLTGEGCGRSIGPFIRTLEDRFCTRDRPGRTSTRGQGRVPTFKKGLRFLPNSLSECRRTLLKKLEISLGSSIHLSPLPKILFLAVVLEGCFWSCVTGSIYETRRDSWLLWNSTRPKVPTGVD